ncbi:MAG: response regulator transcription factor [Bacteroidales bacterium]
MKNEMKINEALISKNSIEFFRKNGHYFAIQGGKTYRVLPGSKHYLVVIELAVKHPEYRKLKTKYPGNLVYGFIDEYLSGFNQIADVIDGELNDCDGDKITSIGKISSRERQLIYLSSEGLADKQIASTLGIATNTVIATFQHLRERIHATSKYHIISMASRAGII